MDLDNLKYSELQKLAKSAGIRANMKVFTLRVISEGRVGMNSDGMTVQFIP